MAKSVTVTGSDDPTSDVPAVQAAVDLGGTVFLSGKFDFGSSNVLVHHKFVQNAVIIIGQEAFINGGAPPFTIQAPGKAVGIRGLTFQQSTASALDVKQVAALSIVDCVIADVAAVPVSGIPLPVAIGISLTGVDIVGDLEIVNNNINIGGTNKENTIGIFCNGVGVQGNEANIRITGNAIRKTTRHGIDLRNIVGWAAITRNELDTGEFGSQIPNSTQDQFVDGIRCLGTGSYLIADNRIICGYDNAAGIRLQGNSSTKPIARAVVINNDLHMNPVGQNFGTESAGIELRRACMSNCVIENRLQGIARVALALVSETVSGNILSPGLNTLVLDLQTTLHSNADVSIGTDVSSTIIVGQGYSLDDQGTGTVAIPRP